MKKSFEEIYSDLCEKSREKLEKAKSEKNKKVFTVLIICLIINMIIAMLDKEVIVLAGTIAISALILLIVMHKEFSKFRSLYKKLVIEEIVKQYDERLNFSANTGVSKLDYNQSRFDNSFDEFYSEDRIFGTISEDTKFEMSQVITKEINQKMDENGNITTEEVETFNGLYGIVKLEKSSNTNIHIANNSIIRKYDIKRIEMDSAEFEKQYDCLAEDKILTMKIFTSDLIEKFVALKKDKISNFEVKIEKDMLYFRYRSGEFFEPPKIKNLLDRDVIKKYYGIIAFPVELVEKIVENINKI